MHVWSHQTRFTNRTEGATRECIHSRRDRCSFTSEVDRRIRGLMRERVHGGRLSANMTTRGNCFASETTHALAHGRKRRPAERQFALSLVWRAERRDGDPSPGAPPRLCDGFPYVRNSIRLPSSSGALQFRPVQFQRRSQFCNNVVASLDSFPSHSCTSVGPFRTQARRCVAAVDRNVSELEQRRSIRAAMRV